MRIGYTRPSRRTLRLAGWTVAGVALTGALLAPTIALATPEGDGAHQVTICHRTNSVTNPYVVITVDYSGADGALVHDNGNGDHSTHLGPLFDFDNPPPPPHNGDQWGDIIPEFSWPGDKTHPGGTFPGLNDSPEGLAILAAGCVRPTITITETVTSTVTSTATSTVISTVTTTVQSNTTVTETVTETVTQSTSSSTSSGV
jgi:hypothetical protein